MTLTRPKRIILIVAATIAVLLLTGFLAHKIAKNRSYSLLENAVSSQSFAASLSEPKRTSTECYSAEGQDYCPALAYELTDEACKQLNAALKKAGCDDEYAKDVLVYKGKSVTYNVFRLNNKKTLEVYVNEVNKLY